MIELRVLGGLKLRDSADGHEILSVLARAKPAGLLVYLGLSPPKVRHGREELFSLLWPRSATEKARNSLNQAVHILRQGLGPGVVGTTEDGELFLEAGALWCDVAAFDDALDSGHVSKALELYRGHLGDGSDLSDCPAYNHWLDGERQRLRLLAVGAAVTLARQLERDGSFLDAAQWLRQARDWAPYDESVVKPLLILLHRLDEHAAAVRECDEYEKRLADVALMPSMEMSELIDKVRSSKAGLEPAVISVPQVERTAQRGQRGWGGVRLSPDDGSVTTQPGASWRARGIAAAALVLMGAIAVGGGRVMRNGQVDEPTLDPTRVLVDIFQNETGDPSLDALGRTATDLVTAGLTATTFVDVVSLGTQLLSHEPVDVGTSFSLVHGDRQGLSRANGTGTVVWGSYYSEGDSLRFLAHVTNASTGEELATIDSVRGPVDAPLPAVERLRDAVMTTLARHTDPRLARWMTDAGHPPTLEAYAEFVEGMEHYWDLKSEEAIPYFLRAVALDSDFTMASLWAAHLYTWVHKAKGDSIRQALNTRRDELAPLERLFLDYQLAFLGFDSPGALAALRQLIDIAPSSEFLFAAGNSALSLKRPAEAIEFFTRSDPESRWLRERATYWVRLTTAYHEVGNYEGELAALDRMRQLHPETARTRMVEFRILAALGRIEELGVRIPEEIQRAVGPELFLNGIPFRGFSELRAHGYPEAASELEERTLEWFEGRTSDWRQDPAQSFVYAKLLSRVGRWDEAQEVLRDVEQAVPPEGVEQHNTQLRLAYALARQGQRDQAFRAIDLAGRSNNLRVRASVEAALGELERAMELLREAGYEPDLHELASLGPLDPLRDYPPFVEEFMQPRR